MRDTASQAQAIEIALLMDDTVLSVQHLGDPRGGRASRLTLALFGAAALSLTAFGAAALTAGKVAAANQTAEKEWTANGNDPIDFRAERVSALVDIVGLLGLASGLGLGIGGLWRWTRERRPGSYRIGRASGVDAPCDTVDDEVVVRGVDGDWWLSPAPGMIGEVFVGGESMPFAAGPIPPNSKIQARLGATKLLIASVDRPRDEASGVVQLDGRSLGYACASAAAHALLILLLFLLPASASGYSSDDLENFRRVAHVKIAPQEDPLKTPPPDGKGGDGAQSPTPATQKEALEAGKRGTQEAKSEDGKAKVKKVNDEVASAARPRDPVNPRNAGALGVINARRAQMEALTATEDFANGLDDIDIRGGYTGDTYAEAHGGWGSAPYGNGPGGGGDRHGTIGTGDYKTPTGFGPGGIPGPDLHNRKPKPTFDIGHVEGGGGYDKNLIRRYVRQKKEELTWCYQKELTVKPTLQGTATTSFTIAQTGRVIEVHAKGLGAPEVERCLENVIRTIAFPQGQIINVTAYPFVFHPVGG